VKDGGLKLLQIQDNGTGIRVGVGGPRGPQGGCEGSSGGAQGGCEGSSGGAQGGCEGVLRVVLREVLL